jgi:hypothetical protein
MVGSLARSSPATRAPSLTGEHGLTDHDPDPEHETPRRHLQVDALRHERALSRHTLEPRDRAVTFSPSVS